MDDYMENNFDELKLRGRDKMDEDLTKIITNEPQNNIYKEYTNDMRRKSEINLKSEITKSLQKEKLILKNHMKQFQEEFKMVDEQLQDIKNEKKSLLKFKEME